MSTQARIVHVKDKTDGAVYIGRAMPRQRLKASPFANPYKVSVAAGRQTAITRFEEHLVKNPQLWLQIPDLRGKALACWCRHDGEDRTTENICHGDVLVSLLTNYTDDELRALAGSTDMETIA